MKLVSTLLAGCAISLMSRIYDVDADDRFSCCMAGWKEIRGVTMCPAPCCHGYEERVLNLPLLQRPTVCHKLTEEELSERQKVQQLRSEKVLYKKTNEPTGKGRNGEAETLFNEAHSSVRNANNSPMTLNDLKNEAYQVAMEDQEMPSERRIRAASEFEDFLFRNKHIFLTLINQGTPREELVAAFERFLEGLSSVTLFEGGWFLP